MNANGIPVVDADAMSCPAATPDKLDSIGVGCFVRVRQDGGCYWAEITGIRENGYTGTIHRELASDACKPPARVGDEVSFRREEINLVGCDNYCWC